MQRFTVFDVPMVVHVIYVHSVYTCVHVNMRSGRVKVALLEIDYFGVYFGVYN
jgi:hypothetical protein